MSWFSNKAPLGRTIQKNDEHISRSKVELQNISRFWIEHSAINLLTIQSTVYALFEYLNQNQNRLQSEEVLGCMISACKPGDVRTIMEESYVGIMDDMMRVYSEGLLEVIFKCVSGANHLKSRYLLKQDYISHQSTTGQMALKRNLSPVYSELMELARLQDYLISHFPQMQAELGNKSFNWEQLARGAFSGAIALAHPVAAVAGLAANMIHLYHNANSRNAFVQTWWNRYKEYLNRWAKVDDMYDPIYQSQLQFVEEKYKNICEVAVPKILYDLDAGGFSLKEVPVGLHCFLEGMEKNN
jgi:hypothetical protein